MLLVEQEWEAFGVPLTVSGDTHTLRIQVVSYGTDEAGTLFGIDGVDLTPISGPGAEGGSCSSTGGDAPAPEG